VHDHTHRYARRATAPINECAAQCVDEAAQAAGLYLGNINAQRIFATLRSAAAVTVDNAPQHSGRVYIVKLADTKLDALKATLDAHNAGKAAAEQWQLEAATRRKRATTSQYVLAPAATAPLAADQFVSSLPDIEQAFLVASSSTTSSSSSTGTLAPEDSSTIAGDANVATSLFVSLIGVALSSLVVLF
jgi:hypothetical protein